MIEASRHTFQILTKRPDRMAFWGQQMAYMANLRGLPWPWPPNVWAGTSVENAKYLPRLEVLARVPAKVRFLSAEPLLGPLDLTPWLKPEGVTVHGNPGLETRGALAELAAKSLPEGLRAPVGGRWRRERPWRSAYAHGLGEIHP